DDEEDDEEEEEEEQEGGEDEDDKEEDDDNGGGVQRIGKDGYELGNDNDGDDDFGNMGRHPKKRKLKNLLSNYEFAPRAPPAPSALASSSFSKLSHGGRNPLTDWTERETFILLNAWGERYLKQGRKSLRSEEWQEVAEKVSQESEVERADTQCRNRLDTLKKKYKKEKMKPASKWVYFKRIDELLLPSTPQQQPPGLSCGVDAGEFIFMNPKVYLDLSNGLDEMRDSPENSESGGKSMEEDGNAEGTSRSEDSFKILAESIYKFSETYQKIEKSKRQQMVELDRMRKEFQRELELQKREIFERAQVEIQKIREGEYDDNEASGENGSG
ncbi:hypothetical protein M569_08403, partial [Genlisea aurea]